MAGYTWVAVLHLWLGFSFRTTLLLANVTPVAWLFIYHAVLPPPSLEAVSQLQTLTSRGNSASEIPEHGLMSSLDTEVTDGAPLALEAGQEKSTPPQRHAEADVSLVSHELVDSVTEHQDANCVLTNTVSIQGTYCSFCRNDTGARQTTLKARMCVGHSAS